MAEKRIFVSNNFATSIKSRNEPELEVGQSDDPHVESVPARAGPPCWLGGRHVDEFAPDVLAAPLPPPPFP